MKLLQLVEIRRIEPGLWEEVVVVRELFLEFAQVRAQRVFSCDVIHAQKVVHSLEGLQRGEELGLDTEVLPPDFPLKFSRLEQVCWYVLPLLGFSVTSDHLQVLLVVVVHFNLLFLVLLVPRRSRIF
jgi:hypothetical protein